MYSLTRTQPQLLDFAAYPPWHTGFIATIASTKGSAEVEEGTMGEEVDKVQRKDFVEKGNAIQRCHGRCEFQRCGSRSGLPNPLLFLMFLEPLTTLHLGITPTTFPGPDLLFTSSSASSIPSASHPPRARPEERRLCRKRILQGYFMFARVMAEKGPMGRKVRGMFEDFNRDLKKKAEESPMTDRARVEHD